MEKFNFKKVLIITVFVFSFAFLRCSSNVKNKDSTSKKAYTKVYGKIIGFGLLKRLIGMWNGPVISRTPAGSFMRWFVDFRPISPAQVSANSELNIHTRNFMSFFVVKHGAKYKLAFRNGGGFKGQSRIAYEVIDKVKEQGNKAYYRFSDFRAGMKRVYTEMFFNGNKMTMQVYTSRYNTVNPPKLHMRWKAKRVDISAANRTAKKLNFPGKVMIKDFTTTFNHLPEAVYLSEKHDPYPEQEQPFVGKVTINYKISNKLKTTAKGKVFLVITTRSLYKGLRYLPENLKYISRYIFLKPNRKTYTLKGVHPGKYFLYAFYDKNGDRRFTRGEYMSSKPNHVFELKPQGKSKVSTVIDMIIP